MVLSQHQRAAATSAASSVSSGGKPARTTTVSALRQQDHHAHLQHQRDLVHRRPQQVVQVRSAGQLAAELIQLLGGARALPRHDRLGADARGQVAGDHRGHAEEEQCGDVLRILDGEGVERRQEEEVVGHHAEEAGEQRGPQAVDDRRYQHRGDEGHRDAGEAQHLVQQQCDAQRDRDKGEAAEIGLRFAGDAAPLPAGSACPVGLRFARAADDVHAGAAGLADQLLCQRALEQLAATSNAAAAR